MPGLSGQDKVSMYSSPVPAGALGVVMRVSLALPRYDRHVARHKSDTQRRVLALSQFRGPGGPCWTLEAYTPPPGDAIRAELDDYVTRRRRELGD